MNLRNKNGIAAILVVLIVVVAVGAGGAAALGVRAVVTGESYLAPFEELGWITLDDDTEEVVSEEVEESSELTQYEISLDFIELVEAGINIYEEAQSTLSSSTSTTIDEDELEDAKEIFDLVDVIFDIYADGNNLTEAAIYMSYGEALEAYYDYAVENEPESVEDYDSYDDFLEDLYNEMEDEGVSEEAVLDAYEDLLDELGITYDETVLEDSIYFDLDKDNGTFECTITIIDEVNEYIANMVDTYADEILEVAEEYLDIEFDIDNYMDEIMKIVVASINSFGDEILSLEIDEEEVDLSDYNIDLMSLITTLYSSGLSSIFSTTDSLTTQEINIFNETYEDYEGKAILGSTVKSLLAYLISNAETNESDGDKLPTVIFKDNNSDTLEATGGYWAEDDTDDYLEVISEIKSSISNSHNYTVSITEYNDAGYVSEITIEY